MYRATQVAPLNEEERVAKLKDAQIKANGFFEEISQTLLRPGVMESQVSKEILELGRQKFDIKRHWHARLVRSGPNTLTQYFEHPPDRKIEEGDMLFVDLGPVFEAWEADFGRSYVLGDDPAKTKLRDTMVPLWDTIKARYDENPDMTGDQLYNIAVEETNKAGYEFGGNIAGHHIGTFPHEKVTNDKVKDYIVKGNHSSINCLDKLGQKQHWILELQIVDRERQIGAFYEQLLTIN